MINRQETWKHFLINRFFRIFPLFFLAVVILSLKNGAFPNILSLILPLSSIFKAPMIVNGVDWTLRIEFVFYVCIAILHYKYKFNAKNILIAIVAISICALVIKYFMPQKDQLLRQAPYISLILWGSFFIKNVIMNKYDIVYLILSLMLILLSWHNIESEQYTGYYFIYTGMLIYFIFYYFKDIIYHNKLTNLLGNLTYSLYLFHTICYNFFYKLCKSHMIAIMLLFFICYLLNKFIEDPFIKYGKILVKKLGQGNLKKQ